MRKILLIAVVAIGFAGCATKPPADLSATSAAESGPVATLAKSQCEASTASTYTAAIVGVQRATRMFKDGRLTAPDLEAVIAAGREARDALNAACSGRRDIADLAQLRRGQAAVQHIQSIVGRQ